MLRCRHSEPRGCPGGVTFNHGPFLGGGVVGYLVPFRIPCRWEPGVPVRRLVLTRYVRNPACLGSVSVTELPKHVVQHLPRKSTFHRSLAISCCASRQSVRGRWNDAHVFVRIGMFCVVARGEGAVDVCLPTATQSPNNTWVPTGPFFRGMEHSRYDALHGPHYR